MIPFFSAKQQPLSLKWKWGILLFIVFSFIGMVSVYAYFYQVKEAQFEAYQQTYQEKYESTISFLEEFESIFQDDKRTSDIDKTNLETVLPEVRRSIHYFESQDVAIRLYNNNNQLIYETKHISIPTIEESDQLQHIVYQDHDYLANSSTLISNHSHKLLGQLEFVVLPNTMEALMAKQKDDFWIILLVIEIVSVIAAIAITSIFLLPLNYLNDTLDMVEEDSLSEIRIRQPKSHDEWSDLNVHVNRLLDKIDLYVRNQKQFVEDVSHELRTPVAIVEGHLKMLSRWGKSDPEVLDESIEASLQEITRMKDLVQEMLDLSRADHIEVDYKDEITEVYSTIRQVYNNFVMIHPDFQFYLDSEKEGTELYVRIFRNHFEQILIILLDNAVKYSRDRHEIHISVSQSFAQIEIAIQDFGEGMTEEDKERVFGRFYRVDKARSRNKGGNGLGLSIAKQLVDSYRGKIRVESVLGYGSIFYVEFPILNDTRQIHKSKLIQQKKQL
ncbi:sensor histidine kinase [Vaginisenegalia massiliensis]|uniref:sensor histidine kinase n=1 Tax=Vaginisenegalia massiliensis TaxID=2058294 RepID=UPI000F54B8D6|nr:HAMP domain-containing sensor histidine kinase [Vaginisenegalia massiliensis]